MSQPLVERSSQGVVRVLTVHNPPVNVLSPGVPEALIAGLTEANADPSVQAVVLIGGGRTFIAGADAKTFDLPTEHIPDVPALIEALEGSEKPVVAALHGTALGAGLEVALASHYRVAAPDALLGLPEVKLGLLPGAGGTQRLTRAVGVKRALEMMLSGEPIGAREAASLGLVDELIEGDLLAGAVAFAGRVADRRPLPRLSERRAEPDPEALAAARAELARAEGLLSPHLIVELVAAATERPFEEGTRLERERFLEARQSPQSRALRHLFFAERAAAKVAGVTKATPTREVRRVGVVGAGTMGGGIAMSFLNAGMSVTLLEADAGALERGLATVRANYEASVRKGRLSREEVEARLGRLTPTLELPALAEADLIIEAVFEDMDVKKEVFGRLDALAKPGAILATNTSTLDVNELAATTSRPEDVLGLHFFSPANVMKLVEIVRGERTSAEVLATALALTKRLGKVGVVVGVCDGFVGNRMIHAYVREAQRLVEEGAAPHEVDGAMHAFGLPMGPFEMGDLAGLDIGYAIRQRRAKLAGAPKPDDILDRIVERGRKGQKTKAGVYDYPEGRKGVPSAEVAALIDAFRAERGVTPRRVAPEEITKRLLYTLVNEGARLLEEGIAARAGDIDVIYRYGYGFPAHRGGPLHYADAQGLGGVVADIRRFGWAPAPLLVRLADEGKTFADFDRAKAQVPG
jgi:3-hydroxyacyl-CoA dehydrogenase